MLSSFFKRVASSRWFYAIGLPLWVLIVFLTVEVVVSLAYLGVHTLLVGSIDESIATVIVSVAVYGLALLAILGLPWLIGKRRTTLADLGLQRLPTWLDIVWAVAGVVGYVILTAIITGISFFVLPFVDPNQAQDTGFPSVLNSFEYILAFICLVVLAPIAEETLFRGYLFGKLKKHISVWLSVVLTSLLFGFVHFQWNVSIDVFALSLVLCFLRVSTDSIWASVLVHMAKNGLAFYLLFINPALLSTLG